jgi:hypothetical protein
MMTARTLLLLLAACVVTTTVQGEEVGGCLLPSSPAQRLVLLSLARKLPCRA